MPWSSRVVNIYWVRAVLLEVTVSGLRLFLVILSF